MFGDMRRFRIWERIEKRIQKLESSHEEMGWEKGVAEERVVALSPLLNTGRRTGCGNDGRRDVKM